VGAVLSRAFFSVGPGLWPGRTESNEREKGKKEKKRETSQK
jgi:hypothetical protein